MLGPSDQISGEVGMGEKDTVGGEVGETQHRSTAGGRERRDSSPRLGAAGHTMGMVTGCP